MGLQRRCAVCVDMDFGYRSTGLQYISKKKFKKFKKTYWMVVEDSKADVARLTIAT